MTTPEPTSKTTQRRARGNGCIHTRTRNGRTVHFPIVREGGKPKWLPACATPEEAEAVLRRHTAVPSAPGRPVIEAVSAQAWSSSGHGEQVVTVADYLGAIYLPKVVGFDLVGFQYGEAAGDRDAFRAAFIDPTSGRWKNARGTREDQARIIVNTILPCVGPKRLDVLEPADAWCMVEGRVEGFAPIRAGSKTALMVSPKTALNELNVFSGVCRDAMARGYAAFNVTDAARYLLHGQWNVKSSASRVVLSAAQRYALYATTAEDELAVMRLLGTYGLRLGEALAIPDANFDPVAKTLRIDQSWSRSRLIGPKTEAGNRLLILADEDVDLLLDARARARRAENRYQILFPGPRGGCIDPSNWRETVFHPTAQRAAAEGGIPQRLADQLVPHSLRHTAISLLLEVDGIEMHDAKAIAGHSSVTTTVDLYGHVKPRKVPGQQTR